MNDSYPEYFKILLSFKERKLGYPSKIPWEVVSPFEQRAKINHGGQGLLKLNSRGGLSPSELYCLLNDQDLKWISQSNIGIKDILIFLKNLGAD